MFSDDQATYILLHRNNNNNNRNPWSLDKKTMLMVGCLILPVTLFCVTYLVLFGIYEKLVYPAPFVNGFTPDALSLSRHRAILYNSISYNENTDIPLKVHTNTKDFVEDFRLVCYYDFPVDENDLQVQDVDVNLCTHLLASFAQIRNNSIYLDKASLEYLKQLVELKQQNMNLIVMVSVGGSQDQDGFPLMVKNHTNRKTFIKSVVDLVKETNIDGIDLDWEFPGDEMHFDPRERLHFTQLLSETRKVINKQTTHPFLLTVAVAAPTEIIEVAYDVSYMNEYVDFVNLMSYDYHFYTDITPFTGINSPLYPTSIEKFYLATLNVNYSSHYWNSLGMDKKKINIGLPLYGHTFRLRNAKNHDPYAPSSGYGKLGELGFASYATICDFLQTNHISPVFDMESFSPYAAKYYEWISFDDPQSLTYKTEFIKTNQFGGAMAYSMNLDDFKGICKMNPSIAGKFPLLRTIKAVLDSSN